MLTQYSETYNQKAAQESNKCRIRPEEMFQNCHFIRLTSLQESE